MELDLLLTPPPSLVFKTPELHFDTSLPSPPTSASPLMLSPISSPLSPIPNKKQSIDAFFDFAQASRGLDSPLPSYLAHTNARLFSTGPASVVSSDESSSPLENALGVDFEPSSVGSMAADYQYAYSYSYPGTPGSHVPPGMYSNNNVNNNSMMNQSGERKPQVPQEFANYENFEGEGHPSTSPYMLSSDSPFVSDPIRQEYLSREGGAYQYIHSDPTAHMQQPTPYITYTPRAPPPGSPFVEGSLYYASPVSVSTNNSIDTVTQHHSPAPPPMLSYSSQAGSSVMAAGPMSATAQTQTQAQQHIRVPSSPIGSHGAHVINSGQGGCDPRFVSGSHHHPTHFSHDGTASFGFGTASSNGNPSAPAAASGVTAQIGRAHV